MRQAPLHYTGNRGSQVVDVLGTALSILCGHWRYAHMSTVRGDTLNPPLLGMSRTVSEDAVRRRSQAAAPLDKRALRRARAAVESASGKALLRKRGQHVERAFCHILNQGGLRRATLKGCEKLSKRYLMGALNYNLSLLLRTPFGVGTSKQWLAAPGWVFWRFERACGALLTRRRRVWQALSRRMRVFFLEPS